ncbi:MAG: DUF1206 domain-containing protein [Anderseniella sp.]|nr:DUF1206 domain-containing protein [Anderseniella sp.]
MQKLPRHFIIPFARAGYAARGLIYLVIGIFAIGAAFWSFEKKDTKGAVLEVLQLPLGMALIIALLIGLAGYVSWRLVQAIFDTDDHGLSLIGSAVRLGLLASAATYTTLGIYTLSLIGVFGAGGSGSSASDRLAGVIGSTWAALAFSAIFAGVAMAHWWKAYHAKYRDHIEADSQKMTYIDMVSRTGLVARGLVLAVISVLFFKRFTTAGAQQGEPGLMSALNYIHQLPAGNWLLAAMGFGLLAFALYSIVEARWRRINVHDA